MAANASTPDPAIDAATHSASATGRRAIMKASAKGAKAEVNCRAALTQPSRAP